MDGIFELDVSKNPLLLGSSSLKLSMPMMGFYEDRTIRSTTIIDEQVLQIVVSCAEIMP